MGFGNDKVKKEQVGGTKWVLNYTIYYVLRGGQVSGSIMKSKIIQTRLSTEFYVIKTIIRGVGNEKGDAALLEEEKFTPIWLLLTDKKNF